MKKLFCVAMILFSVVACSQQSGQKMVATKSVETIDVAAALSKGQFQVSTMTSAVQASVVKDAGVVVKGVFKFGAGTLDLNSTTSFLDVGIDVASFSSGQSVRDERVSRIFFETEQEIFKSARFQTATLSADLIAKLKTERKLDQITLTGSLSLHGATIPVTAVLNVNFDESGVLVVTTAQPIKIKISELSMNDQLSRLKATCGHQVVNDEVVLDVHAELLPK